MFKDQDKQYLLYVNLLHAIRKTQKSFTKKYGWTNDLVEVNLGALLVAVREYLKDISIFKGRRQKGGEVFKPSWEKHAGSLAFRLFKHQVFSYDRKVYSNWDNSTSYQAIIPVAVALQWFHKIDPKIVNKNDDIKFYIREIRYLLSHRHVDQESLALAFRAIKVLHS